MSGVIAKLAGVALSAVGPIGWAFTPGGRPHTRLIEVSDRAADELLEKRGAFVPLEIEAGERKLKIEKLLVVDVRAGSTPYTRKVMVADRRYLWRRKVIARDFNMRRRTGEVRLSKEGRPENKALAIDVAYAPWSLDKGQAYDAVAVLRSVLEELEGAGVVSIPRVSRLVVIEDLFLNDPGDAAVDKVLGFLAGIGVWVDRFGIVRVYDTRNYAESRVIFDAGPPLQGHGFHGRALRSHARPSRVNVYLEREGELRFDYVEDTSAHTVIRGERESRDLENVIQSPDLELSVTGGKVARGTVLEINNWFAAIAGTESRTMGSAFGPLSQLVMRKYSLGQWHLISVNGYGVATASGQPDLEWKRRMSAVRFAWRRLFRILPRWRDKVRSMKAVRTAIFDPETGVRAPTEAYTDYITRPADCAWADTLQRNPDIGHQVQGWRARLDDPSAQAAPAVVTVMDEEAGLILVDLRPDPWGTTEAIAPGNVAKLPTHRVNGDPKSTAGQVISMWGCDPLLATFKLAVVISCVQGAPNHKGRYHKVEVAPARGEAVLGVRLGECLGPEMDVYIPAGTCTARFAWSDDHATQIENAFFDGAAMPDVLLVNPEQVKAVAEAAAAREWAQFLDREEGAFTVALNPDVEIDGAIAVVEHTVPVNGPPVTSIAVYPEVQAVDPMALVPPSVQRTIRKLVQP